MFKTMKLGLKIGMGFGLLILLSLVVGGVSAWQMHRVSADSRDLSNNLLPEAAVGSAIERASLWTMFEMRGYVYSKDKVFLESGRQRMAQVKEALVEATRLPHYQDDPLLREKIAKAEASLQSYQQMVQETVARIEAITQARTALDEAGKQYMRGCYAFLEDQNQAMSSEVKLYSDAASIEERHHKINLVSDIIDLGNGIQITTAKAEARNDPGFITAAMSGFPNIEQKLAELKPITRKPSNQEQIAAIAAGAKAYQAAMRELLSNWLNLEKLTSERLKVSDALLGVSKEASETAIQEARGSADDASAGLDAANLINMIGLVGALVVGVVLAVLITLGVTRPIHGVITGMGEGADQVASAAGQVNNASQQLAQGSAQQAAALEQTASALEEMSSMTRTNADNASQADRLMSDTRQVVERANRSMAELTDSMDQINQASQETSKIIKTIDEIAFQTNLLALNAAVEAARAGEAGAGFAVVAEEVRNLALRAAEAARNTTSLIEQTLGKVRAGSELVGRTNTDFGEVAASSVKVAELVGEIAAASREQAQGIDQVNRATSEMDQVTQQNAANAQQSAAAAQQLSAQAMSMQSFVEELVNLVGGSRRLSHRQPQDEAIFFDDPDIGQEPPAPVPAGPPAKVAAPPPRLAPAAGRPAPEPAREIDEFENF